MGLDQELRRRIEPKNKTDKVILALDFKAQESEEVFSWRKDYNIDEYFGKLLGGVENCEEKEVSKENLIAFLEFLKECDGKEDKHWKGEIFRYEELIEDVNDIIKNYDNEDYVYYYWIWF